MYTSQNGFCTYTSDGDFLSIPYQLQSDGSWGMGYFGGGAETNPTITCSGEITATFTWDPDYPNEPPPDNVIVAETCYAKWQVESDFGGTGTADNALGSEETDINNPPIYGGTSSGTRYSIVPGGASVVLHCSPSANVSSIMGDVTASVGYSATATPVVCNLGGTKAKQESDGSISLHILIGQGCAAGLDAGPYQLGGYRWTITGDTIKDYLSYGPFSGAYSQVDFLTADDLSQANPIWYWRSDSGEVNVYGQATAFAGSTIIGTVVAHKTLTVWAPYYFCGYSTVSGTNGDGVWLYPNTDNNDPNPWKLSAGMGWQGISWSGHCKPPDLFHSAGQGKWAFMQMMLPGRWYTTNDGIQHSWSINGLLGLDTSYPYPFWVDFPGQRVVQLDNSDYGKPDDDFPNTSSDGPSITFDDSKSNIAISDQFWTYMMYRPPDIGFGHTWVPLHRIAWQWNANVNRAGSSWANNGLPSYIGPVVVTEDARCKTHPIWNRVHTAAQTTWQP